MTTTEFSEDRVAALRTRVMADVDADVRRRGRRARLVASGAAALVVVAGLGLGAAVLGSPSDGDDPVAITGDTDTGRQESEDGATLDVQSEAAAPQSAEAAQVTPVQDEEARSVITTGSAEVAADDPAEAATDFGSWAEGEGGLVDHRSDREDRSELTVRVPSAQVNAAIEELRDLGEVASISLDHQDVTSQIVDLDARIEALQTSVARLTDLMAKAATTDDLMQAESMLTQRQAELDGLVAQRASLGDQVELSSLAVTFVEPDAVDDEDGGFTDGLRKGWDALVSSAVSLVTALGVITPWLVAALALAGLAWVVTRLRPRR
ncbi:MAG: DUF4349 domain-containing protein [Aeromicrobium sp.]|uniref:DUF4349 domain-containing protein n=1 Tax=Aeromicrobium sp. TaxID=1871063 RepID=UPI0039E24A05